MIQLKVYPNNPKLNTEAIFLDLYESSPIKLTISIEDITSADATSVFSRTFKVPATRHNEEFFEQAYLVQGVTYDITVKKPAEILVDGAEFKIGHVRLQKIYINGDMDKIDYELLFLGETRDFSSIIADKPMCELLMPDLVPASGAFSANDVVNSWQAFPESASLTAGQADGNILFPLIDHGNTYTEGIAQQTIITLDNPTGNQHSFTESAHPLSKDRMKPMIRAKRIWDQIFTEAGYTYSSAFLDSDRFSQMYVSAFGNNAQVSIEVDQSTDTQFQATESTTQGLTGFLEVNDVVYNPTGAFDPTTSKYVVAGDTSVGGGYVEMSGNVQGFASTENSDGTNNTLSFRIQLIKIVGGGANIVLQNGNYSQSQSFFTYDSRNNAAQQLSQGDILKLQVDVNSGFIDFDEATDVYWECTAAPGSYNPIGDLDCDYLQIDFIKDILTSFRLVMQPDVYTPNKFIIEPWQDFIGSGVTYDWSHKIQKEKDLVIEPLFNTQSQIIEFAFAEDEDYINSFHQTDFKHPYGWLRFNSNNELLKGDRKVDVSFASTPLEQIEQRTTSTHPEKTFVIPIIHSHEGDDGITEHLAIKPVTRFLFYNGLQDIVDNNSNDWYLQGATTARQTKWPLVSQYENWPITASSLNLNWSTDVKYYMTPFPGAGYNENGVTLFDEFWSRYISSIYNKFTRRLTASFVLDNTDLQNLTFDDLIFVNGVYYRPEKIMNAEVGGQSSTKVQLITVLDAEPVWANESLTVTSVVAAGPVCGTGNGTITIVSQGTPTFTLALNNGYSQQFTSAAGQGPYTMVFDNIPPGTYSMTLTDALGRLWVQTIVVPTSSGSTPINWSVSGLQDATVCGPPNCDGEVTVTVTGGQAPYTIFWNDGDQDGGNGPFTRTDLCADDYLFYIEDNNGCVSSTGEVDISCNAAPSFRYQARKILSSCLQIESTIYTVSHTSALTSTAVVELVGAQGCYQIYSATTDPVDFAVQQVYADCTTCYAPPAALTAVQIQPINSSCSAYVQAPSWNAPNGNTIVVGDFVKTTQNNTQCYEVLNTSTTQSPDQGSYGVQDVFSNCQDCQGYVYQVTRCVGGATEYIQSDIARQIGGIYELDPQGTPYCIQIVQLSLATGQSGVVWGSQYKTCSSCTGVLTGFTCHEFTGPGEWSYTDAASSIQFIILQQGQQQTECVSGGTISQFSGSGGWQNLQTLCSTLITCP